MAVARFTREYSTVRRAEGWGSLDAAYYRALPERDLTGRFPGIWRIRARSFATFRRAVLEPLERQATALRILDVGAGNGWLSNRLVERGHWVSAIDLSDDTLDGLGAARHYRHCLHPLLAEFDHLPLPDRTFDLVVFNASLHYSTDYAVTLREALRVQAAEGTLVIFDSPMYHNSRSGARMVQEREARFRATYGFASDALPSEHFLTPSRLSQLAGALSIAWRIYQPRLDVRDALSRAVNGIRARREPARFPVIVGTTHR